MTYSTLHLNHRQQSHTVFASCILFFWYSSRVVSVFRGKKLPGHTEFRWKWNPVTTYKVKSTWKIHIDFYQDNTSTERFNANISTSWKFNRKKKKNTVFYVSSESEYKLRWYVSELERRYQRSIFAYFIDKTQKLVYYNTSSKTTLREAWNWIS